MAYTSLMKPNCIIPFTKNVVLSQVGILYVCETTFTQGQSQISYICSNIFLLGTLNIISHVCIVYGLYMTESPELSKLCSTSKPQEAIFQWSGQTAAELCV